MNWFVSMLSACAAVVVLTAGCSQAAPSDEPLVTKVDAPLPPIASVTLGRNREFRVNGRPFLPIMSWAQDPKNFKMLRGLGINTFVGNQSNVSAKMQCDAARDAGGYGVPGFRDKAAEAIGHPYLLAWIHGDEPDMPRTRSDGEVVPAKNMKVNASTPYSRIVDGVTNSWTAIQPLEGAEFTIKLGKEATLQRLAVWLTLSGKLSVAKEIVFSTGGTEVAKATLEKKAGRQVVELPKPVTLKELTVKIVSVYPDESEWGSIGEIEGLDADGNNVLVSKPYTVPKRSPEEVAAKYREIKSHDASRPVFVTFTTSYMVEHRGKYDEAMQKKLYPAFMASCDVAGFDEYPIYGSSHPNHLNWPAYGVDQLRAFAGPRRPIYVWLETHKGSRWMTYERQLDVLPKHTRFEVWSVLIRGATAVGYFTHAWRPKFTEFAPTPDMQAELKRLNGQITRLAGAILAEAAKAEVKMALAAEPQGVASDAAAALECQVKATDHDGSLWIFAQNMDLGPGADRLKQFQQISPRGGKATFTVAGLKAGTKIEVVDEDRTITAQAGKFTDEFPPLREHVYKVRM